VLLHQCQGDRQGRQLTWAWCVVKMPCSSGSSVWHISNMLLQQSSSNNLLLGLHLAVTLDVFSGVGWPHISPDVDVVVHGKD